MENLLVLNYCWQTGKINIFEVVEFVYLNEKKSKIKKKVIFNNINVILRIKSIKYLIIFI